MLFPQALVYLSVLILARATGVASERQQASTILDIYRALAAILQGLRFFFGRMSG